MKRPIATPYNYRQRTATAGGGRGSRSVAVNYYNEEEEEDDINTIRKGPWKAEEDEVLINHVNKYGPREWSSIRSKGLLCRTGKSCRLRWVNKLRPNLKNGCKFSAEEERLVIQMQAQIGNKWARIATYLPGRTDNDVKNFWSSRQKRLARMRQASSTSSSSTPPPPPSNTPPDNKNNTKHIGTYNNTEDDVPSLEVLDQYSFPMEEMMNRDGGLPLGLKPHCTNSLFSAYISHEPESMRMVELPSLMNTNLLNGEANKDMQMMMTTSSTCNPNEIDHLMIPFPHSNVLRTTDIIQPDHWQAALSGEELLPEPNFTDVFGESGINDQLLLGTADGVLGNGTEQELMIFGDQQQMTEFGDDLISCNVEHGIKINGDDDLENPDLFFDEFPGDVLDDDQMEILDRMNSLPSPSKW